MKGILEKWRADVEEFREFCSRRRVGSGILQSVLNRDSRYRKRDEKLASMEKSSGRTGMRGMMVRVGVTVGLVAALAASSYAATAKTEFGTVKVSEAKTALTLQLNKTTKVVVTENGTKFPVGTYVPMNATLMKQGPDGKVWSVETSVGSFTVVKDQTVTLTVPGTINVKVAFGSVTKTTTGKSLLFGLVFNGPNGEGFGQEVKLGAARVPAPQFQIVDSKGTVLQTGSFEYG